jgi:hypothetical protein
MSLPSSLLYRNAKTWAPINLDRLQHWIDQGRITSSPEQPITARELFLSKCINNAHDGIKILGDVSSLSLIVPSYHLQNFQGP